MIKIKSTIFVVIFIYFGTYQQLLAQKTIQNDSKRDTQEIVSSKNLFNNSRHKVGFIIGYGFQNLSQQFKNVRLGLNVPYHYETQFYQLQYYFAVVRKTTWSVELLFQPQYNTTKFRSVDDIPIESTGFEYGLNGGILVRKNLLNDKLSFYGYISAGPHYASGTPERQADGFIFSDNFFVGFDIQLFKNLYLDMSAGFRHISNAGFKRPNGGVHQFVGYGGVFVHF